MTINRLQSMWERRPSRRDGATRPGTAAIEVGAYAHLDETQLNLAAFRQAVRMI